MVAGFELTRERAEYGSHSGGERITGLRTLEETQPLLEHADRRVAISTVNVAVILARKPALCCLRLVVDEPRIEEEGFRSLTVGRAVEAAAHELGRLAPSRRLARLRVVLHQLCTQGNPAAFQPPTDAR